MKITSLATGLLAALTLTSVRADINVGVTVTATGPAAALGIPVRNTFPLLPTSIGGEKVNYIVLDDATDSTQASKNARRLVSENHVDILVGSTATTTAMAALEVAAETQTPIITIAPAPYSPAKQPWVFQMPQNADLMAGAVIEHMKATGVRSLGFIGYADPYGDVWWHALTRLVDSAGIKIAAQERFQRADTSVTGQVLKLMAANPDAVLIVASGTPAVMPQASLVERGYKGKIYQTHAVATREFLRVGGKKVEGALFPVGPVLMAEQLPDSHPSKKVSLEYIKAYEGAYGPHSRSPFAAHAWDAGLLLQKAIPEALKKARPGTAEFRKALRDALENAREVAATNGVFNISEKDHQGFDSRARVMVKVVDGDWSLIR